MDQTQEDVLSPDVVVIEQTRFFLRQNDDTTSPVRETLEHVASVRHVSAKPTLEIPLLVLDSAPISTRAQPEPDSSNAQPAF